MTEPKEEKCEACCGSGYINFWTDDGHISMRICRRCDGYGYIKAKPMTNEEWLKSANTEQLADVFFEYRYINATPQQQLWLSANEDFVKGGIVEWLKQPHHILNE